MLGVAAGFLVTVGAGIGFVGPDRIDPKVEAILELIALAPPNRPPKKEEAAGITPIFLTVSAPRIPHHFNQLPPVPLTFPP